MNSTSTNAGAARVSRLGSMARVPGSIIDLVMSSLFINILALALPLILLQVYDRIIPNQSSGTLSLLILGVGVALVFEAVFRLGRSYITGWVSARFEHLTGCAAMEHLLSVGLVDFEQRGTGILVEKFGALHMVKDFYSGRALLALLDFPFVIVYFIIIAYIAGSLVLVPIVIGVIFAISALLNGRHLHNALNEQMMADDRRFSFIVETIGGIHNVKGMAMETQMLRRYERLQEACGKGGYDVAKYNSNALSLGSFFAQLNLFSVVSFGSTYVINGTLTVGGLAACTLLGGRALQPLQTALGTWVHFQTVRLAHAKLTKIFDMSAEAQSGLAAMPRQVKGSLELRDVSFQYEQQEGIATNIFSHANIMIEPGESIGISSGNATGKTTLLFLMMGVLRPDNGSILLDGHDIAQHDRDSCRPHFAYLPQRSTLFNGTIMENITAFRDELDTQAQEVATNLGLDEVISKLPLGYETKIGDSAYESLPQGIQQRISVARALVTRPRVILFDEANSFLDSAADEVLGNFLEKLQAEHTMVIVSHRPSTLKMCNRIFELRDGQLLPREAFKPSPAPKDNG